MRVCVRFLLCVYFGARGSLNQPTPPLHLHDSSSPHSGCALLPGCSSNLLQGAVEHISHFNVLCPHAILRLHTPTHTQTHTYTHTLVHRQACCSEYDGR